MTKNMTRRGLAFGAAATLAITGISALPAQATGIANDYVVIEDTEEYGNYNMLSTGYIELSGSFAFAAESGGELKFHVQDPDEISVFDVVPEGAASDTLASADAINDISVTNGTDSDTVTFSFDTAPGIELGDALSTPTDITVSSAELTADQLTALNGNLQVARVKTVASTNLPTGAGDVAVSNGTGPGSTDVVTVTLANTFVEGDMIIVANAAETGGARTYLDGTHRIASASASAFTYNIASGSVASDTTLTISAGAFVANSVSFTAASSFASADIDSFEPSAGTVTELTSGDALDSVANLRLASFGAAGVVGVATARSTVAATDGNYVVNTSEENTSAGDQVVRFATTSDAAFGSIIVTAWIDNDSDGVIDSTEYVSDPVTVSFVVPSTATFTISQENVYLGSSGVTAVVTADLNLAEIGDQSLLEVSIDHIDNGSTVAETDATLTFDTTDENLQGSDNSLANALAAGDSIRFAVESANTEVGAPATFGVGSLTVAGSVLSIPATTTNTRAYNIDTTGTAMGSQAVTVRSGARTVTGSVTVYTDDPTDVADNVVVPNVPYTISVTSSAVTAADGVKFNGKTVDGGTETITGMTDASGQIALSLTSTLADASDVVTVEIDVQGKDKTALMAFTFAAVDYDVYDMAGELSSSTDYNTTIVPGGTLSRTYKVADQWGAAPADGTHVVTATRSGSRTVLAASWNYQAPVVGGLATVTIVDNGTGTGSDTVTIKSYPLLAGGGLDAEDDSNTYTLTYATSVADVTPTAVTAVASHDGIDDTLTNDQPVALEPDALVNHDSRATGGVNPPSYETNNVDTTSPADGVDAALTLTGTVTNANGGVIPGAVVTIAAPGAGFKFTTAGSATVYAADSITVRTGAAGTYSVNVYGGTGGKKTFTVTAGAASATEDVTFAAGGAVSTFTLTTPAVSKPGKTVDVAIKLTDKYGNPVQGGTITLSSTGPGYLLNTSGTTLANGTYNTKLLVGAADEGTAVISATVTIAGVATTKTASIVIGANAVASADQKVNAGSFKGYVALYAKGYAGQRMSAKVGKDWVVVPVLASNFERVVEFTGAGYTISVPIYIDRVLVDTITVTTK